MRGSKWLLQILGQGITREEIIMKMLAEFSKRISYQGLIKLNALIQLTKKIIQENGK